MLIWSVLAVIVAVTMLLAVRAVVRRGRRHRRRTARRARNMAYQRWWDAMMVRPRIKRLTFHKDDGPT